VRDFFEDEAEEGEDEEDGPSSEPEHDSGEEGGERRRRSPPAPAAAAAAAPRTREPTQASRKEAHTMVASYLFDLMKYARKWMRNFPTSANNRTRLVWELRTYDIKRKGPKKRTFVLLAEDFQWVVDTVLYTGGDDDVELKIACRDYADQMLMRSA